MCSLVSITKGVVDSTFLTKGLGVVSKLKGSGNLGGFNSAGAGSSAGQAVLSLVQQSVTNRPGTPENTPEFHYDSDEEVERSPEPKNRPFDFQASFDTSSTNGGFTAQG